MTAKALFTRCPKNPILSPVKEHDWEDKAVFNPGATFFNGKFYLLYRAVSQKEPYISVVGKAVSDDGINFERDSQPFIFPEENYERFGIEDLRINPLEGTFYLTHTVLGSPASEDGEPHQIGLIQTDDFKKIKRMGVITPREFCSKDAVFLPEKIGENFLMFQRPLYLTKQRYQNFKGFPVAPSIWISFSDCLTFWDSHCQLLKPLYWWEDSKIGSGPPPIKTEKGWLFIYHGVQKIGDNKYSYRAGLTLLDLNNPRKVLFRSEEPILEPEEDYELFGDVNNVVFPTGFIEKDGVLYLYYGAADTTVCLATASLKEVLEFCN